jgi:hypothetical protein
MAYLNIRDETITRLEELKTIAETENARKTGHGF